MNDLLKEQNNKKKPSWRKYIIAAVTILCLLVGYIYKVATWTPIDPESRKASETIIRQAVAGILTKDPNNQINPNDLTDEDFAKITEISIYRKELTDIKLLEKFTNLQSLDIYDVRFPEKEIPSWMKILAKLGFFDLSKRFSIDLSPLENLTNLQELNLGSSQISNIEPLKELKNLQRLTLSKTNVIDIKPLAYLTNLISLKLTSTQVSDIKPLVNLINLLSLKLGDSKVADFKPLANLTNVERLDIASTQITDLEPLKALKNLKILNIQNCSNITDEQIDDLQKAFPDLIFKRGI